MSEPEILAPQRGVDVTVRPHPFSPKVQHMRLPHGLTIRGIVGERAVAVSVEVGGTEVPETMWARVRPKPGAAVVIIRFPQGGSAKSIFRLIAFAALAVGVAFLSGGAGLGFVTALGNLISVSSAVTAGLLAATAGLVGSLIINALIPPSSPGLGAGSASTTLLNSITGTGNQITRYGPIPCVLGTILFFPPYAALPYTEVSGDDQYLRCLFDLGYGDPDPADMKIGDTDLASYTDVETEIGVNPSLYSQDILEEPVGAEMDADGNTVTRTTGANADEISLDYAFPAGLFGIDSDGKTTFTQNFTQVDISPAGAGTWTTIVVTQPGLTISTPATDCWVSGGYSTFRTSNGERKAVRVGIRFKVANGQYDVRLTRVSTAYGGAAADSQIGTMQWTVLRTIRYGSVSNTGTKKLAMRIKATDQLSGSISQFSCVVSQPVPVWNATTSTWVTQFSTNPAYIFRWMLRDSPANPRPVAHNRIDDTGIKAWGAECAAKGFTYSISLASTTLYALLKDIAAAGRASFTVRDGKYSIVRDVAQGTPVQVFTPRNSYGFGGNRAFPDAVHALRVQFINPEANYQQDERVVYDDGFGDPTMVAAAAALIPPVVLQLATNFEQLQIPGCVDAESAWKLGRYHLAQARLRPNTYVWSADVENLVCNRGDLVLFANDVISVGLAWGRIKSLDVNSAGDAVALHVDEQVSAAAGTSYAVRLRRNDASIALASVAFVTYGDSMKYLPLAAPVSGLNPGDLFCFGVAGAESMPLIITKIEPTTDLAAKLTAVDASPAVLTGDSGTVPAWSSQITGQPWVQQPPVPSFVVVDSAQALSLPNDAGNTSVSVVITVNSQFSGKVN